MKINYSNYFDVFADARVPADTVIIHESGRIKISSGLMKKINSKTINFKMAYDYQGILIEPKGINIRVKQDGSFLANKMVSQIDRSKELFPIEYSMNFDDKSNVWLGTKCPPRKMK